MYVYESHMGSLYTTDYQLSYDERYCEQCGDSDWLLGTAETKEEAWELLKDITNINDSGGWDYEYIQEFINSNFADDYYEDEDYVEE